jgi:hypothetical protein
MGGYTAATTARIEQDRTAGATGGAVDSPTLAAALTWLGERLYYLAALGVPPFDDEEALVDVITHIWMATLYPGDGPRR